MITIEDARLVAERLGLSDSDDANECRLALEDVALLGQDGFEDQTLREAAQALQAAYAGQPPTYAVIRRAQVRKALAVALREFTEQRDMLAAYDGPAH